VKISPDTKDFVLFIGGLLGIFSQGLLAALQVEPSYPLLATYLTMVGLPFAFEADRRIRSKRNGKEEKGDEPE
jgi:hypothetical protein